MLPMGRQIWWQARWNGDKWEYSTDGGEAWTDEAPEGSSVSEDGTTFSIGGDGEDLDNFDFESFWQNLWPEYLEETRATNTVSV